MSILENLGGSLDKGLKAVSTAGKEFMEVSRLKNEIAEAERIAQERTMALGRLVFDMLTKGDLREEPLRQEYQLIQAQYRKINETRSAIEMIETQATKRTHGTDTVTCGPCGGQVRNGDRFCGFCGAPVAATIPAGTASKACPSCGKELKAEAQFCNKCGTKAG